LERRTQIHEQCRKAEIGCFDCKSEFAKNLNESLQSFRSERARYASDQAEVERILHLGAEKARGIATQTLKEVKRAIGL
jgi:tryptophanyl-tRNA synthetase